MWVGGIFEMCSRGCNGQHRPMAVILGGFGFDSK
jgi:hypothetical protein